MYFLGACFQFKSVFFLLLFFVFVCLIKCCLNPRELEKKFLDRVEGLFLVSVSIGHCTLNKLSTFCYEHFAATKGSSQLINTKQMNEPQETGQPNDHKEAFL